MAIEIADRREMSLEQAQLLLRANGDSDGPAVVETEPAQSIESQQVTLDPQPVETYYDAGLGRPASHEDEWTAANDFNPPVDQPEIHATETFDPQSRPAEFEESDQAVPSKSAFRSDMLADVRMVLESGAREIAGEVRNSLDFHRSQEAGGRVSSVVLSGAALEIDGFAQTLEHHLALPVRCEQVNTVDQSSQIDVSPHRLAIAAGLVTDEVSS